MGRDTQQRLRLTAVLAVLLLSAGMVGQTRLRPELGGGRDDRVRLARADDRVSSVPSSAGPVEGRLEAQFKRVFGWENFWEACRRQQCPRDDFTKVNLSSNCRVEIESISPTVRETRVYVNGTLASRTRQHVRHSAPKSSDEATGEQGSPWDLLEREPWRNEAFETVDHESALTGGQTD